MAILLWFSTRSSKFYRERDKVLIVVCIWFVGFCTKESRVLLLKFVCVNYIVQFEQKEYTCSSAFKSQTWSLVVVLSSSAGLLQKLCTEARLVFWHDVWSRWLVNYPSQTRQIKNARHAGCRTLASKGQTTHAVYHNIVRCGSHKHVGFEGEQSQAHISSATDRFYWKDVKKKKRSRIKPLYCGSVRFAQASRRLTEAERTGASTVLNLLRSTIEARGARFIDIFRELDTSGDGLISRQELHNESETKC